MRHKQRGHIEAEYGSLNARGRLATMLAGNAIGFIGFGLIVHALGWIAAIGIFLLLWGNNIVSGAARSSEGGGNEHSR